METIETYKTLAHHSQGEYKEKGSKFIAFCYPIKSSNEVAPIVKDLKSQHFKACHHCFSFRLGHDKNNYRANDDGEPSGTAGMPILGQIDSFGLTNTLIVVVRYYGGTKLGVPGLINAYRTAAMDGLKEAKISTKIIGEKFKISFIYAQLSDVMQVIKQFKPIETMQQDFNTTPSIILNIPISLIETFKIALKAKVGHLHKEEINDETNIEGLIIEKAANDA